MSDSNNFDKKYKDRAKRRGDEASLVRKIVITILTILLVIIIGGGVSGYLYVKSAMQPVDASDNSEIAINVPMGSSTSQIAEILEENGVIENSLIFRFYTKFKNESGFQAGEYSFSAAMTFDQIIESLKTGKVIRDPLFKVTIPEGRNLEQIAEIYAESPNTNFSDAEFMEMANDEEYVQSLMSQFPSLLTDDILQEDIRYPLEGYLFASTYQFYSDNPSVEAIIQKMLEQTRDVVVPYKNAFEEKNMTIHEGITFASLLENEARSEEDRKKIAGVFYNRLNEGMPLQTDPTVLYALGEHKDRVLYEDLEVESPYNTYQIQGLPVGPISNFNKNALVAAAEPDENEFLYFLASSEDGTVYYAETLEKHNELKAEHIN